MDWSYSKIVAPVCSVIEAEEVISAGANEVYCGVMLDSWVENFGEADLISRRQGRPSHLCTQEDMAKVIEIANKAEGAALTLNAKYSRGQVGNVLNLIQMWEDLGGRAVVVSDIGILLALNEIGSNLKRYLSLLTGTFNSRSVSFFNEMNVERVVLPRELNLKEISVLIKESPRIEYEALVLNQRCRFIDGFCGFYHGVRLPQDGTPSSFDYKFCATDSQSIAWSYDPDYEGHGCQIPWQTSEGFVKPLTMDVFRNPYCAMCQLGKLLKSGVRFFKIAGRGLPTEIIIRSVHFLKKVKQLWQVSHDDNAVIEEVIQLYHRTFGTVCNRTKCYYLLDNTRETR